MRAHLSRIGNSQGIIIPKPILAQIGVKNEVDLTVEDDAIVIRRPRPAVRVGWADDSKRLGESERDVVAWPEFSNDADRDLAW